MNQAQFRPPGQAQPQQNQFQYPPQNQAPPFMGQQTPPQGRPGFPMPNAPGGPPNYMPPPVNRMPTAPPLGPPQRPAGIPPQSSQPVYGLPNSFSLVQQQLQGGAPPLPQQQQRPPQSSQQLGSIPPGLSNRPTSMPQPSFMQGQNQQNLFQPTQQNQQSVNQFTQQPSLAQQLHQNVQMKLAQGATQGISNLQQGQPSLNQQQQLQSQPHPQQVGQGQIQAGDKGEGEGGIAGTTKNQAEERKGNWQEYTASDGRKYYYNEQTKKSVWHKPVELMTEPEKEEARNNWNEVKSKDGRMYFYNKATKESRWDIPEELKKTPISNISNQGIQGQELVQKDTIQQQPLQDQVQQSAKVDGQIPQTTDTTNKEQQADNKKFQYATKAEAKEAFKQMFLDANIKSDTKWEAAFKQVESDKRFSALVTEREKRSCYQEYQSQKRQMEKDEVKNRELEIERQHIQYIVNMEQIIPTMRSKYILPIVQNDQRFKDFSEEKLKEMISEAVTLKEKKLIEEDEQGVQEKIDIFKKLLEKQGHIKASTEWSKIKSKFTGYEEFESLDKVDALRAFIQVSKEVEKADESKQEKEKQSSLRIERQNRDVFKFQLKELRSNGEIHAKSRWPEVYKLVKKEGPYQAVESNLYGSRPKELFEDTLEEMEVQYEKDKAEMKSFIKANGVPLSVEMTEQQFVDELNKGNQELQAVSLTNKALYFEEISSKLKEKEAKEQHEREVKEHKRYKKAKEILYSLFQAKKYNVTSEWGQILPEVQQSQEFQNVNDEELALQIFQEFQKHQAQKAKKKKKQKEIENSSQDQSMEDAQRSYDSGEDISELSQQKIRSSSKAHKRQRDSSEDIDEKAAKKSKKSKKVKDKKDKKSRKQKYDVESSGEYGKQYSEDQE